MGDGDDLLDAIVDAIRDAGSWCGDQYGVDERKAARAILAAVGDATADEVRKALTQRPQIVESFAAVAETALGYRAALERIAEALPYRLTHREIASIARMALTDDARIEEGNA